MKRQRVDDFMDDEDRGEFGIAPQRVQTKDDFTDQTVLNKKRKTRDEGPIPGVPVLKALLRPARDNVATRLLKQMGWKEGQGIGARQTRKEKKRAQKRNEKELYLMEKYGCDLAGPSQQEDVESSSDEDEGIEITFAPDDFDPFLITPKNNLFGLGYSGLDKSSVLGQQRFNLFQPLEVLDKNNKKLSISGQAFGVGAFEAEDEDIYARDDMTNYDFSLQDKKKKKKQEKGLLAIEQNLIEGFEAPQSQRLSTYKTKLYRVTLPDSFRPRNWSERRSRFEPLNEELEKSLQEPHKLKGLGRHDLNPDQRASLLNEPGSSESSQPPKESDPKPILTPRNKFLDMINKKYESFEKSSEVVHETLDIEEKTKLDAKKITESLPTLSSKSFKPFQQDAGKQKRYEAFCEQKLMSDEETMKFLATLQPIELSQWDRKMEKQAFVQARKMYRPLDGLMLDRFVSESEVTYEKKEKEVHTEKKAVQMHREKVMWKPNSILCKRFNVPEPYGGSMVEEKPKPKSKYSVFDYLEVSVNKKEHFVTPIIIPAKSIQESTPMTSERDKELGKMNIPEPGGEQPPSRISVKDIFEIEKTADLSKPLETVIKLKARPKTELEQKSIELKDQHPSEKKDLFKAIFESSDSETEDEVRPPESDKPKPDISEILKKSANELNILRNNSPPRGIFASLFKRPEASKEEAPKEAAEGTPAVIEPAPVVEETTAKADSTVPKILFRRKEERTREPEEVTNMFGPKPPPQRSPAAVNPTALSSSLALDQKLKEALNSGGLKIVETWVEKDKLKKKKSKDKRDKKHHKKDKKKSKKKHKDRA